MYSASIKPDEMKQTMKAPELVAVACSYQSRIQIRNNRGSFNAKSMMGMLALDPTDGSLVITAEGPDEEAAVHAVVHFLLEGF